MADLDFSVTATPKELVIALDTSYFWNRGYVHRGVARLTERNSGAAVHWIAPLGGGNNGFATWPPRIPGKPQDSEGSRSNVSTLFAPELLCRHA